MIRKIEKIIDLLKSHAGFHRYLKNFSWVLFEQILRVISVLLVSIWVARYLGPSQFGLMSYSIAFASIFAVVAKLGLDGILVRDMVLSPGQYRLYLGTSFYLKLFTSFIIFIFCGGVIFFYSAKEANFYSLLIIAGLLFQSLEVIDFYFQSVVSSKYVSMCKLLQLLISCLIKIYLIHIEAHLVCFIVVILIDQVTLSMALYMAYRYKRLENFFGSFDFGLAKKILSNSWPALLSSVVLIIQAKSDQLLLSQMVSDRELGYYSAAMRLVEAAGFLPTIMISAVYPAIVNAKKINEDLYKNRLLNMYRLMMVIFLLVAVPVHFFGGQIISLAYKDGYEPAGQLLSIMSIRIIFTNFGMVRGAYLTTENLMKYTMVTMTLGAALNLMLNYALIPNLHSYGAIWAANISFFVSTFLIDIFYHKARSNFYLMLNGIFLFKLWKI